MAERRPAGYPKLKNYKPSKFMLPTSHYDTGLYYNGSVLTAEDVEEATSQCGLSAGYFVRWVAADLVLAGDNSQKSVDNFTLWADGYQKIKDGILSSLGEKADILPDSTVDSLTTPEMLYARYASQEYAEKGFDFSCISALYYQAFEEAYNLLIWRGYADELNALEINGQKYTDILEFCKGRAINPP